ALTGHVRTNHFSVIHPTKSLFSFSLDYPREGKPIKFQYSRNNFLAPIQEFMKTGKLCNTEASRQTALADEVRAYQTMCRYLLFKLGISDAKELDRLSKMKSGELSLFLDSQENNTTLKKLCGNGLNPKWVKNLLLHYFAKGGDSGREHL